MYIARTRLAALAALALVAFTCASGCSLFSPSPDKEADAGAEGEHGELCAAPASGGAYCVPWSQGPAEAWRQAFGSSANPHPIQMWAERPEGVTLDALVTSPAHLAIWFGDNDAAVAYVRDVQANAEGQKASLGGDMSAQFAEAQRRQDEIRTSLPVDAIGNFKKVLGDKATAEKGAASAQIAADTMSLAAVHAVVETTKADAAPLAKSYASIIASYAVYRATEAAEVAAYAALAKQASQAIREELPALEQAVMDAAASASHAPEDLTQRTTQLSAQIQELEVDSGAALAPYADVLAAHAAPMPDLTSGALRSLDAILGYIQQRVLRSDTTARALLEGMALRSQALALLPEGSALRASVAAAKLAAASKRFSLLVSARLAALAGGPPRSATLNLPLLAQRYDQLVMLLELAPLCDAASSAWREEGCAPARAQLKAAAAELQTSIPAQIKAGLALLRAKGMDAAEVDAAYEMLARGDVKGAALAYDAAVLTMEGT